MTEIELPEPWGHVSGRMVRLGLLQNAVETTLYTAEQLQDYARAAVLAERERIAQEVDAMKRRWDGPFYRCAEVIVAAIRKGNAE